MGHYLKQSHDGNFEFFDQLDPEKGIICYVKGSCKGQYLPYGKGEVRAGGAAYFFENNKLNLQMPLFKNYGRPTHFKGYIMAALLAVKQAKKAGFDKLSIVCDLTYLVHSMNKWIKKWELNGWKRRDGEPLVHAKPFQDLLSASKDMEVKYYFVPKRHGLYGNIRARTMARKAADEYC